MDAARRDAAARAGHRRLLALVERRKEARVTELTKVLIAEDETIVRLDLAALLGGAGYDVVAEARDGEEAVALALAKRPDVALLDVKMPRLDGLAAAQLIMRERPIPIVMLTAYGYGDLVSRALDAGVFGYVVKPFRERDLLEAGAAAAAATVAAARPLAVDLPATNGGRWPLAFLRRGDGELDVRLRET
jgi:CheY-like chemotaxis protein